jgi:hypothetical protein
VKALDIQRRALEASCRSYDAGEKWEALRLATHTYTLVHDHAKKSRSVLTQLGAMDGLKFVSACGTPPPRLIGQWNPLVVIHMLADRPSEYLPKLDEVTVPITMVSFKQWWERDIIFKDSAVSLTRKRLVFALRNQDGGSHLDEELRDPGYVELAKVSRTFAKRPDHAPQFLLEAESAIMRHVAWELTKTLVDGKIF